MKFSTNHEALAGLLSPRPPAASSPSAIKSSPTNKAGSKPRSPVSGQDAARQNELHCVAAVARWGHLRIQELARAVWPAAKYGEQVAARTVRRLVQKGLLLERRNALASRSFCLTRTGASWLELRGIDAQHTLDLTSVAGATFFHRTFATRYLIEREIAGQYVAGEYLILRRKLPFNIDRLVGELGKLPDGFAWNRTADGTMAVEFVEQELANKSRSELEKCLRTAQFIGATLPGAALYRVAGLVFVFDGSLSHARRILLAANSLWKNKTAQEQAALEKRVKLVAVQLRPPLVWISQTSMTLHDYRRSKNV